MFDKGILGIIWGVSFIYGVLAEQVLSKKIDVISIINVVMKNAPIAADLKSEDLQNIFALLFLSSSSFSPTL